MLILLTYCHVCILFITLIVMFTLHFMYACYHYVVYKDEYKIRIS